MRRNASSVEANDGAVDLSEKSINTEGVLATCCAAAWTGQNPKATTATASPATEFRDRQSSIEVPLTAFLRGRC